MANNTLKNSPKYQVVNGLKYFKLQSPYPTDYTKNCGLLGNEIDENFFFLRSYDIESMHVDNGILKLKRVDGDILSADISMPYTFKFDDKTGKLIITDGNGDVQVLEGFVVEGKDVRVATDATLNGDGTKGNPLRISELEKTGTYAPADEFIDMAVYDYYSRASEESHDYYYYGPSEEPFDGTNPEDYVELPDVPTDVTFDSPKYIKVRKDINLPDATKLGAGYRVVTRESIDNFGLLYNYDGVKKIQEALDATGSLWRVPTRRDWALMLNAAEYCDADRNHDTKCVNEWTGKNAGARAKATTLWRWSNRRESGLPVAGEDSLPIAGTNKFTVYPVGYADGSRGAEDKDFDLEAFTKKASYWSITPANCNGENCSSNVFTRTFAYDTRKVLQESSKPSSRMSLRLVKDFKPGQMDANEIENILGYDMPVVLLTNDETEYSKLWTAINVGFSEEQYDGVYSEEWSAATGTERGYEIVYYINEWDGKEWHKKQMGEGDSIVLLDGGKDESGNTIYNHEWRIYKYSGSTEPVLVDTAEALKEEFQEEIDEINEKIDDIYEKIDEISGITESIEIAEVEPTSEDILKSYELHINGEKRGARIDIPKDEVNFIESITIGHVGATIDPETGVITDGPEENDDALLVKYKNSEGKYGLAVADIEEFIFQSEFKDGFKVEGHDVYVKIDDNSEAFLTVSPDGVKLSGVQDAINVERDRAIAAEESISANVTTLSATVETFSADTVAEIARLDEKIDDEIERATAAEESISANVTTLSASTIAEIERSNKLDKNIAEDIIGVNGISGDTEEGYYIDFAYLEYNPTEDVPTEYVNMLVKPSHEDIIKWPDEHSGETAPEYIRVDSEFFKLGTTSNYISNADTVYDAIKALDDKAKEISDEVEELKDDVEELSGTVVEIKEDVETLSGDVQTLSGQVETFSAATVEELTRLDGQDIADSDSYEMSIEGLTLKRKNDDEIHIKFNGNFGSEMPMSL